MNAAPQIDNMLSLQPRSRRLSSDAGLKPGVFISHNIQLVRPLGAGGMGQVWLAEHTGLDTQVAVKFMWKELASDPLNVARFEREAKLAARIKSPHVVGILDYAATPDGVPFIVMELLQGRDLESLLVNGGKLDLGDTTRVLIQTCKALTKAHALGVVHRDIKAENLCLVVGDGDLFVKVLDFGVAKDEDQMPITVSGTTVGTPAYMSPEQLFRPREVDLRTDLWSAAVLVYRCLTGKFPFGGDAFPSVCLAVAKGAFSPPSVHNKELPAGLDGWFKKAFHRNPNSRFQSAHEMADAFLAELDKAGLLPGWAERRGPADSLRTYATEGERSSRRPSALRKRQRTNKAGILAVAMSAALFGGLVFFPGDAHVVESTAKWFTDGGALTIARQTLAPRLNPTEDPAPTVDRTPRWFPPPSTPAFAEPDVPRTGDQAAPASKTAPQPIPDNAPAEDATEPVSSSARDALPGQEPSPLNLATIRFGL